MTTYEGVPSFGTFVAMKLANSISKGRSKQRNRSNASESVGIRVRAVVNSIVRLVAHLAGFSLLTWAGFTFNMAAGLIVAGLSCFVFAWLVGDSSIETDSQDRSHADPMASRR